MIRLITLASVAILFGSFVQGYDVGCKDSMGFGNYGKCVDFGCCAFSGQDSSTSLCTQGGSYETCCYNDYTCGQTNCVAVVGTWISRQHYSGSQSDVEYAFQTLQAKGINRVYFNIWADGNLYANSQTAFNEGVQFGGDRLRTAIDAGKKYGIEVFAWFEYGSMVAYSSLNPFAQNAANKGWLLCLSGTPTSCSNYFSNNYAYLDMSYPNAADFLTYMVQDIVVNYPDLKGFQFDDHFSLPTDFPSVASIPQSQRFSLMRDCMTRIRDAAKSVNPNIHISYSPAALDFSMQHVSVDWRRWALDGVVMELVPQYYRTTYSSFKSTLDSDLSRVDKYENTLMAGIRLSGSGANTPPSEVDQMVSYSYQRNLRGFSFWLADDIIEAEYNPAFPTFC